MIFNKFFSKEFKVLRYESLIFNGICYNNTVEIFSKGIFSKKINKTIAMYAEGYRGADIYHLISSIELYPNGFANNDMPDIVVFNDVNYTVVYSHKYFNSSESLIVRELTK